ncbi:MAG: DUF3037 domain-containing protein [Muribaculaceae bacterium]|nr:DUF3037 domain-containing protein [Muribaculaceae bacterium]
MPTTPEKHLYEYAVVRYSPRVEREEFINVGLVMMCKRLRRIIVRIHLDENRIKAFFPDSDIDTLKAQLASFGEVAQTRHGYFGTLPVEERFRWLTAVRSACISTSRPHPGLCSDIDETFARIMDEQVL